MKKLHFYSVALVDYEDYKTIGFYNEAFYTSEQWNNFVLGALNDVKKRHKDCNIERLEDIWDDYLEEFVDYITSFGFFKIKYTQSCDIWVNFKDDVDEADDDPFYIKLLKLFKD